MQSDECLWISQSLNLNQSDKLHTELLWEHEVAKLVKVTTPKITAYFKQDKFHQLEPWKTKVCAQLLGDETIQVRGIENKQGWLLVEDGGAELLLSENTQHWRVAIEKLARIHQQPINSLSSEFPERQVSFGQFENIITEPEHMDYWEVPQDVLDSVIVKLPDIERVTMKVNALNISKCLCHGDAHAKNVLVDEGGKVRWFDWGEAHVGNPLVDIGSFLWWLVPDRTKIGQRIKTDASELEHFYQTYLSAMFGQNIGLSLYEVMLIGLVHRACWYHDKYRYIREIKPYYVTYTLKQLAKLECD
jgi:thiamine kinase-like enzyme